MPPGISLKTVAVPEWREWISANTMPPRMSLQTMAVVYLAVDVLVVLLSKSLRDHEPDFFSLWLKLTRHAARVEGNECETEREDEDDDEEEEKEGLRSIRV